MKMKDTKKLVTCGLLIAIIIIMSVTPLGYLRMGALSITFLTIPVMIGAILIGPLAGAILGLAFGLTSLLLGGSPLVLYIATINPFLAGVTCILPRVLMGLCCGAIFKGLKKPDSKSFIPFLLSALSAPVLNTVFFMSTLLLCFYTPIMEKYPALNTQAGGNVIIFTALFVGVNAVVEAVACTAVGSAVSRAVYKNFSTER